MKVRSRSTSSLGLPAEAAGYPGPLGRSSAWIGASFPFLCPIVLLFAMACDQRRGSEPGTTDGEVVVEHVTRIGDPDPPGMIGGLVRMSKLRDGRYALYDMYYPGIVRFFGPDGQYLSTLGGQGYGPGEFEMPLHHFIEAGGDTLFIIDVALGRLTALSPDGEQVYDTRIANIGRALWGDFLEDGTFIANVSRTTPEGVGLPLHVMTTSGKVVYSFGTDFPVHLAWEQGSYARHVDVDDEGTIWVAPWFEHRLEKWIPISDPNEPFGLDSVFEPGTVEFPPIAERQSIPDTRHDGPPSPSIRGLWRQPDGPVWMILWVAREDWTERFRDPRDAGLDAEFLSPESHYYKTRLQAVDPATGRVLGSAEVEESWMEFIGDGEAYSYDVTDAGVPYLDLWRVRLVPP